MSIQLEQINEYLLEKEYMVACRLGDIQCLLYNDLGVSYIILESKLSVSQKLSDLNPKIISNLHQALFS